MSSGTPMNISNCIDYPSFDDIGLSTYDGLRKIDCGYNYCSDMKLTSNSLNFVQWNIRGVLSKQDDLICFIRSFGGLNKVNVVCLNEMWLCAETCSRFSMPGYQLFNKCRQGKKGGGLCTLVSSDCISCQIDNVNLTTEYIEYLCVELKCRTRNVILANVYRPPNSNVKASIKELQLLFGILTKSYDSVIVCTDHNMD